MLLLIKEVIGGTVRIERNYQYVTWVAIIKYLIKSNEYTKIIPFINFS